MSLWVAAASISIEDVIQQVSLLQRTVFFLIEWGKHLFFLLILSVKNHVYLKQKLFEFMAETTRIQDWSMTEANGVET